MRSLSFFTLFCTFTAVWAGGYQGCLERVMLFQAYQIDALNTGVAQTVGMKCNNWNAATNTCNTPWAPCRGTAAGGRCNFDELMVSLGGAPVRTGWAVEKNGKLDVQETAKTCYRIWTNRAGANQNVPNYRPQNAMKGTYEWNDHLLKLSTVVNNGWRQTRTDANKGLWDDLDDTMDRIETARAGDHGPFVVTAARNDLGGTMTIKTEGLGYNPVNGAKWEKVDWKETALQARANGVANPTAAIRTFLDNFYAPANAAARSHHQVIRTYKRIKDRTTNCRK